jgi:hypothetical protein
MSGLLKEGNQAVPGNTENWPIGSDLRVPARDIRVLVRVSS